MTAEEWRPVVGYKGSYEVSNWGRVRSIPRTIRMKNGQPRRFPDYVVLATTRHRDGHLMINLCRNDTKRRPKVHSLVAEAFLGPRPAGLQVRHLDDNPANNMLSNLRYGTGSENSYDSIRNGSHSMASLTHCRRGHPFSGANLRVQRSRRTGGLNRKCIACTRAWGRAKRLPDRTEAEIQRIADELYREIMSTPIREKASA